MTRNELLNVFQHKDTMKRTDGFHGTMDGQKADGSQMLYVQDNNGRTLIVGSGDVAYDPTTGKPKDGVGDMLVCLDVQTREPVYVKVEDTTLFQTQDVEAFKQEELSRLQQINSEPYNQAAQEQAAKDAAKPQPKETDASKQNEHSTQGSERDLNATIDKARSGDKESQDVLSNYGIDWGTQGVYRFVNEDEVNSVLNGETYKGRFGNVDVTASQEPTTAANADYRITFKPEHDLYKEEGNGNRARMKNPELKDGYIMDGYSLKDVDRIEKRNEDGSYTTVYDSSNDSGKKEVLQPHGTVVNNVQTEQPLQEAPVNYAVANSLQDKIGGSLSDEEAKSLTNEMESRAVVPRQIELTPDNWYAEFGEDGKVNTPIGEVKMGENQIAKLFERKRSKEFGMIKPTLEDPDAIIEVESSAVEGKEERSSSYLFVKTFLGKNGEKVYYFKSVTVKKDGMEISISSHYDRAKRVMEELEKGKLLYLKRGGAQTEQNQPSVSGATSEEFNAGPSARKDTNNSSNGNENNTSLTFEDGSPVPMVKDSKGRLTPDYGNMKPEQASEILTKQFGESAEKVVDGQIKKAEKAVKDANKMKVNYEGEPNDILEQEELKKKTIEEANKQLEHAQAIKKAMTAKKVAETVTKQEGEKPVDGANQAGSVVSEKFQKAPRLVGNKRSRTLPNKEKVKGHYEIVPAESLTPSHDATNGYKKSDGFPVDKNGHTINDRDYENDKDAQQTTDQIALNYDGQAVDNVPVVSDEGIVYDGNGRTMAGQKAAKNGTDGEYINELLDNAENFGFTREQIEKSGIEHPRLVLVTDERMPYTTDTFAKFNKNIQKSQNNTEQAVAKSKTLSPDDVGSIVSEIEGTGRTKSLACKICQAFQTHKARSSSRTLYWVLCSSQRPSV